MAEPRPSNPRMRRATIIVILLAVAIIATIFVGFNMAHYRALENEQAANASLPSGADAVVNE
jgi:uncharacterized membrane protein AbrB (regulator of aidB expression)